MPASLVQLAPGVYAWLHDEVHPGRTNSGVVIAADGITVVDSGVVPSLATELVAVLDELTPLPTRRLVFSGSHVDLVGGSTAFPLPAVYGSPQTSALLDQPGDPEIWARLHPDHAAELLEVTTRPVTHTVAEPAHLCPASIAVPCAGLQFENLAVQVPGANVVFAGALATFGMAPLGFEADFESWIATLDSMATWGELFVPSHGPIGGVEELVDLRAYLEACIDAKGDLGRLQPGPWSEWHHQDFTPINIERAAMLADGDPSTPPTMKRLLGLA